MTFPRRPLVAAALIACIALIAGCGLLRKPDMNQTASIALLRPPQRPLIFIPGFLGTKLKDARTDRVAWGTMASILLGGDNNRLALSVGPGDADIPGERMQPYAIYDSLWGRDYYSRILRTLRSAGGYRIGDIENPRPGDTAFVFLYDWRKDNVESAARLAGAIDRLHRFYGDPDMKFDLLAHSQGGLIARYYVKYGGAPLPPEGELPAPTFAGARRVGKVVMIGTPNRGCVEALKILHVGVKKVFRPIRPEVVFTMPAVYQMLPPPGEPIFADETGAPVALDLYDPAMWAREGLSVFSEDAQKRLARDLRKGRVDAPDLETLNDRHRDFLARALAEARRFRQALDAAAPDEQRISYHAFGSDCNPTLRAAMVRREGDRHEFLFEEMARREEIDPRLAEILYGAGDGTVLMQSLLNLPESANQPPAPAGGGVEFDSAFFVCEDHGVLPNNPIFQNNLFYLLLRDDARGPRDAVPASHSR